MSPKNEDAKREDLPPDQIPIKQLLRWGKDHAGITSAIPKVDLKTWVLVVDGEVENPLRLGWSNILKFPKAVSISNFHCVEGWSVLGCKWEGIQFRCLVDVVKPRETAKFVMFECADGYTTSLSLEELSGDNVLLAYKLDGKKLEEGLGFPLRLVVPDKYAYKSAMWVTRITFMLRKELGYWEKRGYSDTADVWKNDRFVR
jgi:DMSO/TMAO reductase YedYZ molybdopterin-dependent catalytic subunit